MKIVEIIRLETGTHGTFGVLRIQKSIFCYTLEPADILNRVGESCIPTGQYLCTKVFSNNFGDTYEINLVPNRSLIRFHPGNMTRDTKGCPLLGSTIGKLKGERAVLNSGLTFKHFMTMFQEKMMFHLTIKEDF